MTKLRVPLLSMEAHGTLANSLTYRQHGNITVAERVPTPQDARTLPQLYHRWRYYDAVQFWHSLSAAQQSAYRQPGGLLGLTAYQYFIKLYLTTPTDLVAWYRLDENTGGIAHDSGPFNYSGTLYGPTWTPGKIASALNADGIDDYVDCTTMHHISDAITVMCWLYPLDQLELNASPCQKFYSWRFYLLSQTASVVNLQAALYDTTPAGYWLNIPNIPKFQWSHIALAYTHQGGNCYGFLNGIETGTLVFPAKDFRDVSAYPFYLFGRGTVDNWRGKVDDLRIYHRHLTHAHIHHIATQELYPPPN